MRPAFEAHQDYRDHYVDRSGGPDACWPWTGHVEVHGYGVDLYAGRHEKAHRVAYEQAVGAIPETMQVDHVCHNGTDCRLDNDCPHRRCCNPRHLEAVPQRINGLRGESVPARNARKTECVNGHPLLVEGVDYYYKPKFNRRICKPCSMESQRRRRSRKAVSA